MRQEAFKPTAGPLRTIGVRNAWLDSPIPQKYRMIDNHRLFVSHASGAISDARSHTCSGIAYSIVNFPGSAAFQ